MGKTGFLYESMKDQLLWGKLKVKRKINFLSSVGQVLALNKKDYDLGRVKAMKMSGDAIAEALKSAFGVKT